METRLSIISQKSLILEFPRGIYPWWVSFLESHPASLPCKELLTMSGVNLCWVREYRLVLLATTCLFSRLIVNLLEIGSLLTVHVWVHLFNTPLELFTRLGLSYIASAIRVPLSMDTIIAAKIRLEFVNIPKFIEVELKNGQKTSIKVEKKKEDSTSNSTAIHIGGVEALQEPTTTITIESDVIIQKEVAQVISTNPLELTVPTAVEVSQPVHQENDKVADLSINITASNEITTLQTAETHNSSISAILEHANEKTSQPETSIRGRGRPKKEVEKGSFSSSSNRFEVLNSVEDSPSIEVPPRKPRAASKGNIVLVKNIRGFNSPLKKNKVILRALQKKVDVLCLLETRVKLEKSEAILKSKLFNWNICTNYDHAINGRIWMLWRKGIDISIIQASDHCITAKGTAFGGDFNIFLHFQESSDHELLGPYTSPDMSDFQEFTHELNLLDHLYFGPKFSWRNKQHDLFLAKKLDRILINPTWDSFFQHSFVEFLAPGVSEHNAQGNPMMILFSKLKRLKVCLKKFNKDNFNNLSDRVKLKIIVLENQQLLTLKGEDTIVKELEIQEHMKTLEEAESLFLKQKAKVQWIKDGDKNYKFFHSIVAFKNKRDTIRVILDDRDNRLETFDAMANEVTTFYYKLLDTVDPLVKDMNPSILQDLLNFSFPLKASPSLVKEVSAEEIQKALFSQDNEKAPGPNEFSHFFFKKYWSIVGEDVSNDVNYFFCNSYIHPTFNSTTITLVPKVPNPCTVKDFRPSSCCSVIYKIISIIIVTRLIEFLPGIISLNRTSFIRGRDIIDNVLLAQEMVKGYGRKSISPRCSMKIDLHKTFDSLHWRFLLAILKALHLPQKFIAWIEICFSQARYSIAFNDTLIGYFKGPEV
ncbi:uncharacterized protein LOC120176401 [Hibiscus syriacus]|uniref:uncharacterized protein LOC120176401 n=1 Tax=Hibiscus syriacus TaxID=106335 RepID=UPI001920EEDB|nr:uncharacterized protein LOC120176401 [Hibiscus syriacus]